MIVFLVLGRAIKGESAVKRDKFSLIRVFFSSAAGVFFFFPPPPQEGSVKAKWKGSRERRARAHFSAATAAARHAGAVEAAATPSGASAGLGRCFDAAAGAAMTVEVGRAGG